MDPSVCSRCYSNFPGSNITLCKDTTVPGGLYLCETCHKMLHPDCAKMYQRKKSICCWCSEPSAIIYCPLCTGFPGYENYGAMFCVNCHEGYHTLHKESHNDHVMEMK